MTPAAVATAETTAISLVDPVGTVLPADILRFMGNRSVSSIFVGRQPETALLRSAFERAAAGRPGAVVVGGEAARLFIATKTVSVHVSNILAKLGVASRTEAAAYAHRTGLLGAMSDHAARQAND